MQGYHQFETLRKTATEESLVLSPVDETISNPYRSTAPNIDLNMGSGHKS